MEMAVNFFFIILKVVFLTVTPGEKKVWKFYIQCIAREQREVLKNCMPFYLPGKL